MGQMFGCTRVLPQPLFGKIPEDSCYPKDAESEYVQCVPKRLSSLERQACREGDSLFGIQCTNFSGATVHRTPVG